MKPWQKDQLQRALELRREVLVAEIDRDAAHLREQHAATDEADLTRDVGELRAIEAARCVDCQRRHEKTYRD